MISGAISSLLRLASATVCAVWRLTISLAQPGTTQKEVVGSLDLPRPERGQGQQHVENAATVPKAQRNGRRKTRALWQELDCPKSNSQGSICPPSGNVPDTAVLSNQRRDGRRCFLLREDH